MFSPANWETICFGWCHICRSKTILCQILSSGGDICGGREIFLLLPELSPATSPRSTAQVTTEAYPETSSPVSSELKSHNFDHFQFDKVYSWRQIPPLSPRQAQAITPGSETEVVVTISLTKHRLLDNHFTDLYGHIAIRKGTRECPERPLCPLPQFVTLRNFSPTHKSFLTSLNGLHIPNTFIWGIV